MKPKLEVVAVALMTGVALGSTLVVPKTTRVGTQANRQGCAADNGGMQNGVRNAEWGQI